MKIGMKYPGINDYENFRDSYEMANFIKALSIIHNVL